MNIVTTTHELKAEIYFADGDTRTIRIKNPKENLTRAQVAAIPWNTLIGDKTGAPFSYFNTAKDVELTTINYDIE